MNPFPFFPFFVLVVVALVVLVKDKRERSGPPMVVVNVNEGDAYVVLFNKHDIPRSVINFLCGTLYHDLGREVIAVPVEDVNTSIRFVSLKGKHVQH